MDQIPAGAIPEDQFQPDPTGGTPSQNPAIPPGAIPEEQFQPDATDYGSPTEMAKTAIEQTASGATLGASKVLETKLLGVDPAAIAARERENKITSTLSNIFGTGALIAYTGGIGGLAEGAGLAARAGAGILEGGIIGGANSATDDWSQNKPLDAQKIIASTGIGMLLGGVGVGALEGIRAGFTPLAKVAPSIAKAAQEAAEAAPGADSVGPVVDAPASGVKGVQSMDYQDIANRVNEARHSGNAIELPQKGELIDALSRYPMKNPVSPLQADSLGNQTARDAYGTFKEMPGEVGQNLNMYESLQKNELVHNTLNDIKGISPGVELTSDAVKGGKAAIDAFTSQYQSEKNALKPIFQNLKKLPLNGDILPDAITSMTDAVPGLASMFDTTGSELGIKPYRTNWGIDKATYNAAKEAVESLKDSDNTFENLWNVRKGLDQHIDVTAQGQAASEIGSLKKALMDQLQNSAPDANVRETFKRYAINEQQRKVIEKTFGASVGSPEFGQISKVKPEMIGDKIFGNTANVEAAKNILPPEQFKTILGNWLSEAKAAATDKGAFSSAKFGSFLRRNQDALNVAFADNPAQLQRLKDATTIMRILPDSPTTNTSGTARSLFRMVSGMNLHDMTWEGMLASIPQKALGKIEEQMQMGKLNKALSGKAADNAATASLKSHVEKTSQALDSKIGLLFPGAASQARKMQ